MKRNALAALMFVILLASLGFAQEQAPPISILVDSVGPGETTGATEQPVTTTTTVKRTVTIVAEIEIPFSAVLRGGKTSNLYRSQRKLTEREAWFLATVPVLDGMGMRLRDAVEALFLNSDDPRTSTLHPPSIKRSDGTIQWLCYQQAYDRKMIDSRHIWSVMQPSDADQNVTGFVQEMIRVKVCGTAEVEIPVITAKGETGADGCRGPQGPQGPQGPVVQLPPPPPPVRVLCVQWAAPPTSAVCAPGTIQVSGVPAFVGGGFNFSEGTKIVVSNGSSSTATGGSAWQQQGQWQKTSQGMVFVPTITNTVTGTNTNTLTGGNQSANLGASLNTGIAIDN